MALAPDNNRAVRDKIAEHLRLELSRDKPGLPVRLGILLQRLADADAKDGSPSEPDRPADPDLAPRSALSWLTKWRRFRKPT
ncbi:hypothetical protein BRAS3843_1380077 [Bradyrhizobium sp. STM 3843]|nr:hypothetical protein BRAS3843_1380077 [Bradyrhizobium sp. STM 3843]